MPIKVGNRSISAMRLGDRVISRAYLGDRLVFDAQPASVWTPADLGASLALWLDADDASTITLNGNNVVQWDDKSGNNRHATQGTAVRQPTYTLNGLNGLPVLRFDGINDVMTLPAISASPGIQLFFVLRQNMQAATRNGGIVGVSSSGNSPHFGGGVGSAGRDWFDSFYSTSRPRISTTIIPNGVYVGSIKQTGTQIDGKVIGLINESVAATFNDSPTTFTVGTDLSGFLSQNDYAELVLVQSPSADNELKIEGYLAHKWGLQADLPANHLYKSAPPTV